MKINLYDFTNLTALIWRPTFLPYFLRTSRRFMDNGSKTMHRCCLWKKFLQKTINVKSSVADPEPYVFGPLGSESISTRYGSFYHQAKIVRKTIVRKTLIPTILWFLYDFFIFEKWCKCSFKKYPNSVSKISLRKKILLQSCIDENSRIRSRSRIL